MLIKTIADVYNLVQKREVSVAEAVHIALRQARRRKRWRGIFNLEGVIGGRPFAQLAYNTLLNSGEQDILEEYFGGAAAPTSFKVGLLKTTYAIIETDSLATVVASELVPAQNLGYTARKTITRSLLAAGWPTRGPDGNGDWSIKTDQFIWTAGGAWADRAGFMFLMRDGLATAGDTTGLVLAAAPLSPTRQPEAANDIIKGTYTVTLL
jgi:hypothetical protein